MDVDMVDIQKDIRNTYPYRISMSIMDIQHGYHVWISIISMISRGWNCMKRLARTIKATLKFTTSVQKPSRIATVAATA